MLLKYNIRNIQRERRLLDIDSAQVTNNPDYYTLFVTTKSQHRMNNGDIVLLNHEIKKFDLFADAVNYLGQPNCSCRIFYLTKTQYVTEQNVKGEEIDVEYEYGYYWKVNGIISKIADRNIHNAINKYSSFNDKFTIVKTDDEIYSFTLQLSKYKQIYIDYVEDGIDECWFHTKDYLPCLLDSGDTFNLRRVSYGYKFLRYAETYDNYPEVEVAPTTITEHMENDYIIFSGSVYSWEPEITNIVCTYIDEHIFTCAYDSGIVSKNDILEVEDKRFFDDYGNLYDGVRIFEFNEYINFTLPTSSICANELNDEDIMQNYFNEKKRETIPSIDDYEKRCFSPNYYENGILYPVNKLRFNVFLRDRSGDENWNTNDGKGWNQYKLESTDTEDNFVLTDTQTNGDLLYVLNFTDDDIYYRKKKVEKTFLRLSFYDSQDPLKQMLLFYSTIFLDSGELYTTYIRNKSKTADDTQQIVATKQADDNDDLTISFAVTDKYNRYKSSEGFYLYLFPDGIKDDEKRTIYMKAEFNHAGNGKTVPLIYPNSNGKSLTFKDKQFPTSLITEDGDLTELYRQLFIPVTVKYDAATNEYLYYFNLAKYNKETHEITIGLYEPKLNPLT
jgi:hypothetical protein